MKPPLRPDLLRLAGYTPGEQPRDPRLVKLNTNENPWPPSPAVARAVRRVAAASYRLYPDPLAGEARRAAADLWGISPDEILFGNGSDELLTIVFRAALGPRAAVCYPWPTYSLYPVLARLQGARPNPRPFPSDFSLPEGFPARAAPLNIVANPNSPTGTFLPPARLAAAARRTRGLFVVDEAYADFAGESCLDLPRRPANLVVLRSLSKSYALAGLRAGYLAARPELVAEFLKLKDSYNLSRLTIAAAAAALRDRRAFAARLRRTVADREALRRRLEERGLEVLPSRANFLFVRFGAPGAAAVFAGLRRLGVLVRHFPGPRTGDGLRITVGRPAGHRRLLAALDRILRGQPAPG